MDNEIVLDTDEAAAKLVTVTGWVSRDGRFFGNKEDSESMARYAGCTHRACQKCGKAAPKTYTACDECREKAATDRYNALPKANWDGSGMIAIWHSDTYFNDWDEVMDYCEEHELPVEQLNLVICQPNYIRELDYGYAIDLLPEDGENPSELDNAIEAFNQAIKKIPAISYSSYGEVRAVLIESETVSAPHETTEPNDQ